MGIFLIAVFTTPFVVFNFCYFLLYRRIFANNDIFRFVELITVGLIPALFLITSDIPFGNECCGDSAVFSPGNRPGIYLLIIFYTVAYYIASWQQQVLPPVKEMLLNVMLVMGVIINLLLCIHLYNTELGLFLCLMGNVPILLLLILRLAIRQILLREYLQKNNISVNNFAGRIAVEILTFPLIFKYPALLILVLPVVIVLSVFLLLFGQKPDSLVRAFTETYYHGYSTLNAACDNVECGGHFLCSVGAQGHSFIVKPVRYGERNGGLIICNRQLLVSNAFEELVQQKYPALHKWIRKRYNKIGTLIHRYYNVFKIKWVSDFVYIMMKPLEWVFLLVLYTCDKKPENRIAKQYLKESDRTRIEAFV